MSWRFYSEHRNVCCTGLETSIDPEQDYRGHTDMELATAAPASMQAQWANATCINANLGSDGGNRSSKRKWPIMGVMVVRFFHRVDKHRVEIGCTEKNIK